MNQLQLKPDKHVIVGAGISGLVLALLLARRGHPVSIYDKRTLFDQETDGRSINFTISGRGLAVIEQLGLKEIVLAQSAVLVGRVIHLQNSKQVHYQYGTKKSQVLLSIRRSKLVDILLTAISSVSTIQLFSGYELIEIDETSLCCHFLNADDNKIESVTADCIIGADGVFSNVRNHMLKKQISSFQQTVFDWGYKEYQFTREEAARLQLSTDHMHMWPKSKALLVAIPNIDSTFSVIFTAPLRDARGQLNNFDELVKRECPDIAEAAPSFLQKSGANLHNYLISIKIDRWHIDDKIVLLGDACHATYPFYGQGMNSALEDAVLLNDYMNDQALTRREAFVAYETSRKVDANALHQLSEAHLHQMTKAMVSPFWQACNMLDVKLATLFAKKWIYEYEIVAHSSISYSTVLEMVKKQNKKKLASGFFVFAFVLTLILQLTN